MDVLNPQQQTIVEHTEGPALVIAGAGSGKTRVITTRVARLIEKGVPPSAILMVTFTNKAAEEMLRRVEGQLGGEGISSKVISGTFHSIANRFLRRYAPLVQFKPNFTIFDQTDSRDLIKASISACVPKSDRRFPTASVVQNAISMAFNKGVELQDYLSMDLPWLEEFGGELGAIENTYRQKKRSNNGMDFDDLLDNWHLLLSTHPQIELAQQIRFVLVDEYQDTNLIQTQILEKLSASHKNLMVVGDDAQSIYGWRGANFENILSFPDRFQAKVFRLEENYRSTPNILGLANASINHNTAQFTKALRANRPEGEKPSVSFVPDTFAEADKVVEKLFQYKDRDIPFREMGVLYRNHAQSATLQMRLTEQGIPFVVRSGVKFFEAAHIKDVVAFLKVVFNPLDEIAWLRILKMLPGVGNSTAAKIIGVFQAQQSVRLSAENDALNKMIPKKALEAWKTLSETFKELLTEDIKPAEMIEKVRLGFYHDILFSIFDNPTERETDLKYLIEFSSRYGSLERFLGQLALVGATMIKDYEVEESEEEDLLTLSSIHQAKGLEWDVVFILGLAEGKFPHAKSLEPEEKLEEERRLFYVALTRCRRFLELFVPIVSWMGGTPQICRPSRFVGELPEEMIEISRSSEVDSLEPFLGARPQILVDG